MRVISGAARGLRLEALVEPFVRPTTDRVKEAVFDIIQFEIQGKAFLDLFGGTGQIGIEAASRGAEKVYIVERNARAIDVIKYNVSKLNSEIGAKIEIARGRAEDFLEGFRGEIDVAFLDPPYRSDLLLRIPELLSRVTARGGIIIFESPAEKSLEISFPNAEKIKTYIYGKTAVTVIRLKNGAR